MAKGAPKRAARKDGKAEAAGPAASPRLPAGRHGLPREFIAQNQRERIVTALVDTVAERGYNATTVANITKAASVSRRTFYEHFADKEACFLAAYEMVADHIAASMRAAAESFEEWPQQVRAALATMLRFLAGEPELARLCMIEPVAAGGKIAARHRDSMQGLVEILKAGRPALRISTSPCIEARWRAAISPPAATGSIMQMRASSGSPARKRSIVASAARTFCGHSSKAAAAASIEARMWSATIS